MTLSKPPTLCGWITAPPSGREPCAATASLTANNKPKGATPANMNGKKSMEHLIEDETRIVRNGDKIARVQFFHDTFAHNPWEDCDDMVPMIAIHGRGDKCDYSQGYGIESPLAEMSDAFIARNRHKIAGAFGRIGNGWGDIYFDGRNGFDDYIAEYKDDWEFDSIRDARREALDQILSELTQDSCYLELLAALWRLTGIPAQVVARNGYCQGSYLECLFVAHPDAVKDWGFKSMKSYIEACGEDFESEADVYAAWAFGNFIGYSVDLVSPEELRLADIDLAGEISPSDANSLGYCETVDSCWGFSPDKGMDAWDLDENFPYAVSVAMDAAQGAVAGGAM